MTPLISVCIPAYNHEKYVEATIGSILAQDYPRIELIIVDDNSKDQTFDILCSLKEECCKKIERVIIERNEINLGTCGTLNKLRELSKGDYFLPIASDDILLSKALSNLIKPMLADEDIGVVVGQNKIMDGDGRFCFWDKERNNVYTEAEAEWTTFNDFLQSMTRVNQFGSDFGKYSALVKANHIVNGYLIRKGILDEILPFTKDAPLEDYWLHLQLAKKTKYKCIPEETFAYRWHAANTVKQIDKMLKYHNQTLMWESEYVARIGGSWQKIFQDASFRRKRKWAFGKWIYYDKIKNDYCRKDKWHELCIFGMRIKFA